MEKIGIGASVKYRVIKRRIDEAKPYAVDETEHNCFLIEGMNEMWNLILGLGGTAYNSSNARIGIGNGTTAENESQTGLQGTSKFWKGMASGYPKGPADAGDKKAVFRSVFANGEAEFAWEEVTLVNATDDSGKNMLRIVQSKGTKPSGEEWTAEIECMFQNPA
ncbi:MAG: hypothetical protein QXW17_02055 [Candidatus Bathyarchaeia archaeon]